MNNIQSVDSAIAQTMFDHSYVYLTAANTSNNPVPNGWSSIPTANFKSYAAFSTAVQTGAMPGWTKAVLYDPEDWSQTPSNEQTNVASYMQQFCQLAHQHGWTAIMTPGTDLMNAVSHPGQTNEQAFIANNIAGAAAKYADISETQSQGDEFTPSQFTSYLSQTRSQALSANSNDIYLGGLTANLSGTVASAAVMDQAAIAADQLVAGFFLNVSGNSPDPTNGAGFLELLAAQEQVAPTPTPNSSPTPTAVGTSTPKPTSRPSSAPSQSPSGSSLVTTGSGSGGGGTGAQTVNLGQGSTITVDGKPIKISNGQLDTSYLQNGTHTITVTQNGKTTTETINVQNKLSPFQSLRNWLFGRFTSNHLLMNVGTVFAMVLPITILGFIFKAKVIALLHSLTAYRPATLR